MNQRTYCNRLMAPTFTRSDGGTMPNTNGWQNRHVDALIAPRRGEAPIVRLFHAWAEYADQYRAAWDSGVGGDGVLGPAWVGIGGHLRTLLNGETGRFDCGTLDGFVCETLSAEGVDPDLM